MNYAAKAQLSIEVISPSKNITFSANSLLLESSLARSTALFETSMMGHFRPKQGEKQAAAEGYLSEKHPHGQVSGQTSFLFTFLPIGQSRHRDFVYFLNFLGSCGLRDERA